MTIANEGASAAGRPSGTPLGVQVGLEEALDDVDLRALRGVCVWNLPTQPDDPLHEAWKRAGFLYPRWPFLSAETSWGKQSDASRSMVLDLDAVDALLDGCSEMGIVPLFSFSAMPDELSANPDAEVGDFDGPSHYAPADYREWEEYVSRVVGRVVERGYAAGYYEVWNEPEDYKYFWKGRPGSTDTLADYVELYAHTARAIKLADPTAKVGGPVCAHWDSVTVAREGKTWGLPQFLRAMAQYRKERPAESVPLDFIDWHDYSFATAALSDGVDFVDSVLAEVGWPERPEYLITEWNRHLEYPYNKEKTISRGQRAAHAAWNVIREVNSDVRRIARLYWYVLEGGWDRTDVPLVDGPPRARLRPKDNATYTYGLSPTFAVFEMLRDVDRGERLRVTAQEPLVALATIDGGVLRLMVTNNTPERCSASIDLQHVPGPLRESSCRIQLVDDQHSADGRGLGEGQETRWQVGRGMSSVEMGLAAYATALVTLEVEAGR